MGDAHIAFCRAGTYVWRDASEGAFCVKINSNGSRVCAATSHARTEQGRTGMKDMAKRVASSGALAHVMAMAAMLVIASCIFYIR